MADVVEDIKGRLGIYDLVSQYVQLKKTGRNYKGLCPFHSEKTPSFVVSPEKQICHCFGCNKGGDIFSFIQELEGVTFTEALQILADKAGTKVDISRFNKKAGKSEKDIYFKAHELACEFFEKQLHKTNDGKKVLEYLRKRGLTDATIKEFRIGFAPDKHDELYPSLLKKGIGKDILIKGGLISAKNLASDRVYDKYRTRLIFPIFDYLGRVCGFGGRALKNDQMPKYLNSPENPIYSKSKILYGLSHAKKYIKEGDGVVLVEGYFDVILPYQAGIKNVVATSGTALSNEQSRLIKRLTSNVVTCFDTDDAGFEATKRAYFLLQNEGIVMRTVCGIEEKDPADFVLEKGEAFKDVISDAPNFVSFFIDKLLGQNDSSTLSGRRNVINELLPCYKQMPAVNRDFFVRELAKKLNIKEKFLYEEMDSYKLPLDHPARLTLGEDTKASGKIAISELILALLLEFPFLFECASRMLDEKDFEGDMESVYKALSGQYNSSRENFKSWGFEKGYLAKISGKIDILMLYVEEKYRGFTESSLRVEVEKLIDKAKKDGRMRNLVSIQSKIVEAENSQEKEKLKELLEEQQRLLVS